MPLLSIAIWLPIVFGLLVLAVGSDRNPAPARWVALVGSVLGLIVTIPLIIVVLLFQRRIVSGLTAGGVKG